MWLIMAVLSAFFAGITAVLAKCGIRETDSDVAMAVRTVVVLVFSWIAAAVAGSLRTLNTIELKSFVFLILSGLSTGASWICYFKALSAGDVNKVTAIDKSSSVLTMLAAIVIFNETNYLFLKIICIAAIAAGTLMMIEKKSISTAKRGNWLGYAVLSAVFAAVTSILAKIGISGVESNLGTAVRTCVVLLMAWLIVFYKGKISLVKSIKRTELVFIILSGFATGISWLCYYYAIQNGIVSVVVPVDKLSILVSVGFSVVALKEKLSKKAVMGLCLITAGTLIMALYA